MANIPLREMCSGGKGGITGIVGKGRVAWGRPREVAPCRHSSGLPCGINMKT
ncbi:hypothetical protein M1N87_00965 [Dehalococcoidia bacterium]|nr:hypothetical protein [Dehalococcoidia bacterium]MCL0088380.1 hypothetical protein [Dehalococcoidia bacterium]